MDKSYRIFLRTSLFCFLTIVIMNPIAFNETINTVGKVGKLLFCLVFILFAVLFVDQGKVRLKLLQSNAFWSIPLFLIIFSVWYTLTFADDNQLLVNLAFPIYFLFYYLILKLFVGIYFSKAGLHVFEAVKQEIIKTYRFALFFNLILWFSIAIMQNLSMITEDGSFGGFFQSEIQLGFYAVTGFLVSFYLRFNRFNQDKSVFNLALIFLYLGLSFVASRNSLLIICATSAYFLLISKLKKSIYALLLISLPVLKFGMDIFLQDISIEKINEITTGRFEIWRLSFIEIAEKGFLLGSGLFNLNTIVLKENIGTGFYYLDGLEYLSFHSSYLELFAGGGLLVLLVFLRIIIRTWRRLNDIDKSVMIGLLIGALFESYLTHPFTYIASFFYFILLVNNLKIKVKAKKDII